MPVFGDAVSDVDLAVVDNEDLILCQVTSKSYADLSSLELKQNDFKQGSLNRVSYVRPGKLFTANKILLKNEVGQLTASALKNLREKVVQVISGSGR